MNQSNESTLINIETAQTKNELVTSKKNSSKCCLVVSKVWLLFKNFVHPTSIKDDGHPRLIMLDFLRGIAAFMMLYSHELYSSMNINFEMKEKKTGILATILAAPAGILASFRSFFILISGISHGFTSLTQLFDQPIKQIYYQGLISFVFSVIMWPLWYLLHIVNAELYRLAVVGIFTVAYPFWRRGTSYSHAATYFGFTASVNILLNLALFTVVILPYRLLSRDKKRLQKHHILYVIFLVCLIIVVIMLFCSLFFAQDLQKLILKVLPESNYYLDVTSSSMKNRYVMQCPANIIPISDDSESFGISLFRIFVRILGGYHMSINPQYCFHVMGLGIGVILLAFKLQKQALIISLQTETIEKDLIQKQYKKLKASYLCFLAIFPIFFIILFFPLRAQILSQFRNKLREPLYKYDLSNYYPEFCQVPEYSCGLLAAQLFLVFIGTILFETNTFQVCKKRAERILFLRRLSTLSLSCFIYGYFLSFPIKALGFPYRQSTQFKMSITTWIGYIIVYMLLTWLVQCMFDQHGDVLTADWTMQRFRYFLDFRANSKPFKPVSDQHLNVRPVNLFGREL